LGFTSVFILSPLERAYHTPQLYRV
jgi:hypothetical protein